MFIDLKNFSIANKKTAFNVNFPVNPRMQYPDCIKITPVGRRHNSNFIIKLNIKSQFLYTAQIDSINKNSTSISDDDYTSCLNGYVTVSPITMSILNETDFEKLKKVNF